MRERRAVSGPSGGQGFETLLGETICPLVDASPGQVRALVAHYELVLKWNRVVNLTRVTDWRQAVTRHYGESAVVAAVLGSEDVSVVDMGSGAGFPGIPVAILRPNARVTLVEADRRKGAFLKEACRQVSNCRVLIGRSEEAKGEFEWLVSRAVRWSDLEGAAWRLARWVAILGGEVFPESRCVQWVERRPLPWGSHRAVLIGHVVPRETD